MNNAVKILIPFLLLRALIAVQVEAQHANIKITDVADPNEPSIMINPSNPLQVVAGCNLESYFYSVDGGLSWTRGVLSSSFGVWGDPTILVDTAGSFYFFHLSNPAAGNWIDRIVCQKMDSIGKPWSDGTFTGLNGTRAQDKQWAAVDRRNNRIHLTWTQFDDYGSFNPADSTVILYSRSDDGGLTWLSPVRISRYGGDCVDSDQTVEGAVPAVGPNGEVYVAWAGPQGIMFNSSADGGNTWMPAEKKVSTMPGGWDMMIPGLNRANGLPVTCCDVSGGQYHGNIYINWVDQRNGEFDPDVWFVKSSDGGNTWCPPRRVNNDSAGNMQFLTWMTVDQLTGYIWFVFYDRRDYHDNNTDVYLAVSYDGGDSFVNFRVSSSPFWPIDGVFFGDYTNISAHANVVRPIWARCDGGPMSVWTAIVDSAVLGVNQHPDGDFELEQNSPNPFGESTWFAFKIRRPGRVSLGVYDIFGRKVADVYNNEFLQPGRYTRRFDAAACGISAGVYYVILQTPDKVQSHKILFEK